MNEGIVALIRLLARQGARQHLGERHARRDIRQIQH